MPDDGAIPIETDDIELGHEHMAAIDVLRVAKNAFVWLSAGAIALHLVAFAMAVGRDSEDALRGGPWSDPVDQALAVAGFVARASVLVVNGIFLVSLLVCLSGRMGGAAGLARGGMYALIALAMVTPWISAGDSPGFTSALYSAGELHRAVSGDAAIGWLGFVRFGVCPALVIVALVASQWAYRAAYRRMALTPPSRLPIHEV